MSNSSLINYTKISPNSTNPRNKPITKITIHHVAGVCSVETLGNIFASKSRNSSCTYGVGNDGRIGMYCEEKNRPWTSSNSSNDHQAVTLEVSNSSTGRDWPIGAKSWKSMIDLCVDICKRNPNIKQKNGKSGLYFDGTKNASLTFHYMFANTACPGPYIKSRAQQICNEVNSRLNAAVPTTPNPSAIATNMSYTVKVTTSILNIRKGPGTNYGVNGTIKDKGVYTIIEEVNGAGAKKWGKLKSGAGWISLDYAVKT